MAELKPTYRADIDGLRGVAILLVVLFHARVPGLSGGFIGVDVFFVISGYLITGLLVAELRENGRISYRRFFARRARRLLPMLGVTTALTLVFGSILLVPDPGLRWLAQSVVAVAVSASNVFFLLKTNDYFGATAESLPLLNTWSLAVEEQFYLVWPGLLWVAWRISHARRTRWIAPVLLVGLSVGSLVLAVALTASRPSYAFYLMPTRF